MQNRNWVRTGACVVGALLLLTACGSSGGGANGGNGTGGSSDTLKIGVPAPLSGDYASAGTDIVNAAKLAVKDINAKGGVLGKQLEVIPQDDQCDAQVGVQAAQKLVDQHVVAVAGGYCSGASIPESGVFHSSNIPFVADASTSPQFTEQGYDNVFRTIGRDDEQGPFAAKFIATYLHAKTAAVIHDNTTYAKGLAEQTVAALKQLGVNVVYYNAITPGEKDYTSVLTRVKALNPDVIYYTGYFAEAGILVKQAKQLGLKSTFMGGDATNDPTLLKTAGDAANGMIITTAPLAQFLNGAQDFINAYKSAYNTGPGPYSVYEYDAVKVVAQAIQNAGSADPKQIVQSLHNIKDFHGLTGNITFDNKGDRANPVYITLIVKDGQFAAYMKLDANGQWVPAAQ